MISAPTVRCCIFAPSALLPLADALWTTDINACEAGYLTLAASGTSLKYKYQGVTCPHLARPESRQQSTVTRVRTPDKSEIGSYAVSEDSHAQEVVTQRRQT